MKKIKEFFSKNKETLKSIAIGVGSVLGVAAISYGVYKILHINKDDDDDLELDLNNIEENVKYISELKTSFLVDEFNKLGDKINELVEERDNFEFESPEYNEVNEQIEELADLSNEIWEELVERDVIAA